MKFTAVSTALLILACAGLWGYSRFGSAATVATLLVQAAVLVRASR
jgi:hypothetical protein